MSRITYKIQKHFYGKWLKLKYKKHFEKNGRLIADLNSKLILSKNSRINIEKELVLNGNCIENNMRSTIIRLDENSELNILGKSSFFYGSDIILFKNSKFTIGNSFINSDCKIRCHKHIKIGDDCAISHDFTIMDSDAHYLDGDNHTKPVIIEDNVWIGSRVMILSGVTVGEGAVIAAGSVVRCNVPAHSLVGGVPARVIKENVKWSE